MRVVAPDVSGSRIGASNSALRIQNPEAVRHRIEYLLQLLSVTSCFGDVAERGNHLAGATGVVEDDRSPFSDSGVSPVGTTESILLRPAPLTTADGAIDRRDDPLAVGRVDSLIPPVRSIADRAPVIIQGGHCPAIPLHPVGREGPGGPPFRGGPDPLANPFPPPLQGCLSLLAL